MSDPPIELKRSFAKRLAKFSTEKTLTGKASSLSGFSLGDISISPPANAEPRTGLSMGQHCELMAKEWQIPRADQDQLAFRSHKRAAAAYDAGFLDDLVVPTAGVFRDNNLREDISLEKIAQLSAGVRQGEGYADGGQLDAAHRRRFCRSALLGGLGRGTWIEADGLSYLRPALRDRFCRRRAGAC